jgi:membrane fusion protein (multidrug efflux system)
MSDLSRAISPHLLSLALLMGLAACEKAAQQPPAALPVEVTAVSATPRDVPVVYDFVGKTESSRKVEIRARVEGFLEKRIYPEGTLVKEGQVLFLIDRKPFEARLWAAKAELAEQQARLVTTRANLARVKPLAEQNAVSQKDLDDATGQAQAAAAAVEAAKANVINAELNLSYTTINTPVTGLSSFAQVQDGTYVNAGNSLLTSVSALSPMRVNFSVSENQILRVRDEISAGRVRSPPDQNYEVEVTLADGGVFDEKGRITFADAEFSESTGTFLIRSEFKNANGVLRPGQFVRVRLLGAVRPNAMLVPKRAVQQGAQGSFVWVVNKEGKAEFRPVQTGEWHEDDWIVNQGLQPGETVAVDGAIKLRADAPVKVTALVTKDAKATPPAGLAKATMVRATPSAGPSDTGAAVLPGKVYFDSGSAALSDEAKRTIAGTAKALQDTAAKVEVRGYTSKTGSLARNRELGQERARVVRDVLIASGVAKDRIKLKAPAEVIGSGSDDEAN